MLIDRYRLESPFNLYLLIPVRSDFGLMRLNVVIEMTFGLMGGLGLFISVFRISRRNYKRYSEAVLGIK